MFCAPRLFLGVTEGVRSYFHVLRSVTLFGRYRGRWVQFSCFALPDTFLAVPRASGPIYMYCALGLFLGVTEGVGSRFHVWRSRTRYERYRGRHVSFSSFVLPDSFSTVLRASGLICMFCGIILFLSGIEAVGARFQVLRSRAHFWRYRGSRVPFRCFALPDSFSTVPRPSGLDFMFCAPGHLWALPRASGPVFMFYAPRLVSGGTEGIGYRFQVFRSRTRFLRYGRRRGSFSCFALQDSFQAVPRASGTVFKFCAPGLVFNGT
jgi:hypothetical protein